MAYSKSEITRSPILRTDGGRYDVDVAARVRIPAYWTAKHNAVGAMQYRLSSMVFV